MIVSIGKNPCKECPEREPGQPCRLRETCRILKHYRFRIALRKWQIKRKQAEETDILGRLLHDLPPRRSRRGKKRRKAP